MSQGEQYEKPYLVVEDPISAIEAATTYRTSYNEVNVIPTDLPHFERDIFPHIDTTKVTKALDIGSGRGIVPLYLAMKLGIPAVGYEIDPVQYEESIKLRDKLVAQGLLTEGQVDLRFEDFIANPNTDGADLWYFHAPPDFPVLHEAVANSFESNEGPLQVIDTLAQLDKALAGKGYDMTEVADVDDSYGFTLKAIHCHLYQK